MRKIATLVSAAALAFSVVAAGPAAQDPPDGINHEIEVPKGETQQVAAAGGTGGTNLFGTEECASDSYDATCEKTLALFKGTGTAKAEVTPKYPSDYDLEVWKSDKTGALIEAVAASEFFYDPTAPNEMAEWPAKSGEYYVLIVKYFVGGGGYTMTVGLG